MCYRALLHSSTPEALVEAQVWLTLEHLERQRQLRDLILKQLLQTECVLDTLILPMEGSYRIHEPALESWVRGHLLTVEQERRRAIAEHERRMADLESQLLQLVSQRTMLGEDRFGAYR